MSPRHLNCSGCRIRVSAADPEISLLEGRCPICGAALTAAPSASAVIGYRWFDLGALGENAPSDETNAPAQPIAY
jgi:hypothetical protein